MSSEDGRRQRRGISSGVPELFPTRMSGNRSSSGGGSSGIHGTVSPAPSLTHQPSKPSNVKKSRGTPSPPPNRATSPNKRRNKKRRPDDPNRPPSGQLSQTLPYHVQAHMMQQWPMVPTTETELLPLPSASPYLLAEHLEFFENDREVQHPTYGTIGLPGVYRIYLPKNIPPDAHLSFFSFPGRYLQSWVHGDIPEERVKMPTAWEVDVTKQFMTAVIDFAQMSQPLYRLMVTSPRLYLSFYYNTMIRQSSPTPSGGEHETPFGKCISGCPRPLTLESIAIVEERQSLHRTGILGRGHYGIIYSVVSPNQVSGALKETLLPYTLQRERLDEEIRILAAFSKTFHTTDGINPFGNAYNTGLEHLLLLPPPGKKPPPEPDHKHIAQIHAAFVDPISHRTYHLLEHYEGGAMSAFLESQRGIKETERKVQLQQVRREEDMHDRRLHETDRTRRQFRFGLNSDEFDDDWDDDEAKFDQIDLLNPNTTSTQQKSQLKSYHLPSVWVRMWALQFCFALHSLKSKQIVHGDIAPRNVFFKHQGFLDLVVGDFGTARRIVQGKEVSFLTGIPINSMSHAPHFRSIAPELSPHPRPDGCPYGLSPSHASDVWSCGSILLQCMVLDGSSGDADEDRTQEWANWNEAKLHEFMDDHARQTTFPASMWHALKGMMKVDPRQRSTVEKALNAWMAVDLPKVDPHIPPTPVQEFDLSNPPSTTASLSASSTSTSATAHPLHVSPSNAMTQSTYATAHGNNLILTSQNVGSLFTQLSQSLMYPQTIYNAHRVAQVARDAAHTKTLLTEEAMQLPASPEILRADRSNQVARALSPIGATVQQPADKKRRADRAMLPGMNQLSLPTLALTDKRSQTHIQPQPISPSQRSTPEPPKSPSPDQRQRSLAAAGIHVVYTGSSQNSSADDGANSGSYRNSANHSGSYTPSVSGLPPLPIAARIPQHGVRRTRRAASSTRTDPPIPSTVSRNFYEFDVHPPRWRSLFAFLDWFMPRSLKTLQPSKLNEGTSELFFAAPKMLFQARFCIAFILLQILVGLYGIVYQFARRVNPHIQPTGGKDHIDWIGIIGILIFEVYLISFIVWLKYWCRDRSIRPRIGNLTIFSEILVLCYSTYESSGVGLSFYLCLFSVPTLCFMLVDWKSGMFWQSCCLILLVVVNICWRVNPDLTFANPPTLQNEHDVLLPVGVFLLIFLVMVNFLFRRYQRIVHHHLDLALKQLALQNDFITRTSMSKMKFLNQMSNEIEMPIKEMINTIDTIMTEQKQIEIRQTQQKGQTDDGTTILVSIPSLPSTLSLPHSQSLTFAYLNSLHLQSLIRDMIDVSLIEHYKHAKATEKEERETKEDEQAATMERSPQHQLPSCTSSHATARPPLHLTAIFPFLDEPLDFVRVLECGVKSLSLAIARRHRSTTLPEPPNFDSTQLLIPPYFGRELVMEISPLLYRDARFIGDATRVGRLIRTMVRNALAWSEGDETVSVRAQPRSYGYLKTGKPYVFVEVNIKFVPAYGSLGTTIQPSQFGLWSFHHPADDINLTIIEHMNGKVWMHQLDLSPGGSADSTASLLLQQLGPHKPKSRTATINFILMFPLTRSYDVSPIALRGSTGSPSSIHRPCTPSAMVDVSHCAPPSMSEAIYRASAVQVELSSTRQPILQSHSTASSTTIQPPLTAYVAPPPTYFSGVNVLIVDGHPDGRANLNTRLRAFGVRTTPVSQPHEANTFIREFKEVDEVESSHTKTAIDGAPTPTPAVSFHIDHGSHRSETGAMDSLNAFDRGKSPTLNNSTLGNFPLEDAVDGEDEDTPLVDRAQRHERRHTLPGSVESTAVGRIRSVLAPENMFPSTRHPTESTRPSSLVIFVNQRLSGSRAATAAIGGVEFIIELVKDHPHWMRNHTNTNDHILTIHDHTDSGSHAILPIEPSEPTATSSVSSLLPCPHIVLLTSWSPHGSIVDRVECTHMHLLSQLPLIRPIRFIMKPLVESELYEVIAQVKRELDDSSAIAHVR